MLEGTPMGLDLPKPEIGVAHNGCSSAGLSGPFYSGYDYIIFVVHD